MKEKRKTTVSLNCLLSSLPRDRTTPQSKPGGIQAYRHESVRLNDLSDNLCEEHRT